MRKLLLLLFFIWPMAAFADNADHQKIELDGVRISEVARLVYSDALRTPYLLDPAVVDDNRAVSFRWEGKPSQLRPFLTDFFHTLGYSIEKKGALDIVVKAKEAPPPPAPDRHAWIYRPHYRDPGYLADLLRANFPEALSHQSPGVPSSPMPTGSAYGAAVPQTRTISQMSGADFSTHPTVAPAHQPSRDILVLYQLSVSETHGGDSQAGQNMSPYGNGSEDCHGICSSASWRLRRLALASVGQGLEMPRSNPPASGIGRDL